MAGKKKSDYREWAFLSSIHGFGIIAARLAAEGRAFDFGDWYGLSLNIDDDLYRGAAKVALGQGAASGLKPLGREWASGMRVFDEEVDDLIKRINVQRADAEARARVASGRIFG